MNSRYRFLPVGLTALALLAALFLFPVFGALDTPKARVMNQFYLSLALIVLMTYLIGAVGRAAQIDASPRTHGGFAGAFASAGFPVFHRHMWADTGRFFALAFLAFVGPVLLNALVTFVSAAYIPVDEALLAQTFDGTPLREMSDGTVFQLIASGHVQPSPEQAGVVRTLTWVNLVIRFLAYLFAFTFLSRLMPYFLWRSGGYAAPTLAQTWAQVGWPRALRFGALLMLLIGGLYISDYGTLMTAPVFVAFFVLWLFDMARVIGPAKGHAVEAAEANAL